MIYPDFKFPLIVAFYRNKSNSDGSGAQKNKMKIFEKRYGQLHSNPAICLKKNKKHCIIQIVAIGLICWRQRVPVAQLDRVSDSDSDGCRFESCRVHHQDTRKRSVQNSVACVFFYVKQG